MRTARALLVPLLPLLGACGMGSMGAMDSMHAAAPSASLSGTVLSVDGRSDALQGLTVAAPDLGVVATCDASGHFDLGLLPAEPTRIAVVPPDRAPVETMADLSGCESMEMALAVEGDRIARADMEHCGSSHGTESRAGMAAMPTGHMGHHGEVATHHDEAGHMGLVVEVEGLTPALVVEVVLVSGSGERLSLGTHAVDAGGRVRVAWDASAGDPLPFGAAHIHDLAGVGVEVRAAATGELLLTGTLPDVADMHGDCGGGGGMHGEDDMHGGDGMHGGGGMHGGAGMPGSGGMHPGGMGHAASRGS